MKDQAAADAVLSSIYQVSFSTVFLMQQATQTAAAFHACIPKKLAYSECAGMLYRQEQAYWRGKL